MKKTRTKLLCLALSLCFFYTPIFAQDNALLDSLIRVLQVTQTDSIKVKLLNDIGWELKVSDPDLARSYLDSAAGLSIKSDFQKGEAQAYNNCGVVETIDGNFELAIEFYQKALDIRQAIGDKKGVASLYNNIGNLQEETGDYLAALKSLQRSLKLRKELQDTLRIARVSYNLALVHETMGDYPEALNYVFNHLEISEQLGDDFEIANAENLLGNIKFELERFAEAETHYLKALQLRKRIGDQRNLAHTYTNIGNTIDNWGEQGLDSANYQQAFRHFQEALDYYEQSLLIFKNLEEEEGQGNAFNNIGLVYKNIGSYYKKLNDTEKAAESFKTAHSYLNQSLALRKKFNDQKGIMEVYNGIGDVYRREGDFIKALQFTEDYLALAEELKNLKFKQKAFKDLSRVYEEIGDYKKAYQFRKQYDELRYQRLDEDRITQMNRREALHDNITQAFELESKEKEIQLQDAQLREAATLRNSLIGGAIALLLVALLLYNRYRLKHKANLNLADKNKIIEQERKRSEELLLNILPKATAKELKLHGRAKAKYYESVTVLFSDFKSFTTISEQLSPEELVAELDECFRAFDEITASYHIEKIKTIGDAYMCAGGLPNLNNTHPVDVINAAIEMQAFMKQHAEKQRQLGKPVFEARIGIHTGPVVAGIVGSKKFAYDIWGDTVNMASRMESSSETGKINISEDTFQLVKHKFNCTYRGKITAKKKGEIDMYFIEKSVTKPKIKAYS